LVAFAIPPAMLFGFLAICASFLLPTVGLAFAFLTSAILAYVLRVVEVLSRIPFASLPVPSFGIVYFLGYYLLIVFALFHLKKSAIGNDID